jgi:hypothetical protein
MKYVSKKVVIYHSGSIKIKGGLQRHCCSYFHCEGFQVTYWSCYHVDDIDECTADIPSFVQLKNKSLSQILHDSLNTDIASVEQSSKSIVDLNLLLNKCAYMSCSMINDTSLMRTIDRIRIYLHLIRNCAQFREILIKYLIDLQVQKEVLYTTTSNNWFVKEVANLNNIKKYLTLRNACKNYIESKLSPIIGYILAQIDSFFNLDILSEEVSNKSTWKLALWLNVFKNPSIMKLNYDNLLNKGWRKNL